MVPYKTEVYKLILFFYAFSVHNLYQTNYIKILKNARVVTITH